MPEFCFTDCEFSTRIRKLLRKALKFKYFLRGIYGDQTVDDDDALLASLLFHKSSF